MAQFDVYARLNGPGYFLDCQSDLIMGLSHRLTVPLLPLDIAPTAMPRLNPEFVVTGERVRMMTQFAAAVPNSELRESLASLAQHYISIITAFDVLTFSV